MDELPHWPAALNLKLAAAYCGISPQVFKQVCPVKPVRFTKSVRGDRYLKQRIDEWLLSIDINKEMSMPKRKSLAEIVYGKQADDEDGTEPAKRRRKG